MKQEMQTEGGRGRRGRAEEEGVMVWMLAEALMILKIIGQ